MNRPKFHLNKHELKLLVKKFQAALDQGYSTTSAYVLSIVHSIRTLIRNSQGQMDRRQLRRMLGASAVLVGLVSANPLRSQNFATGINDPFGINTSSQVAIPTLGDLDGDGDFDLMVGEFDYYGGGSVLGQLHYYENVGTNQSANYNYVGMNPFGLNSDTLASDVIMPTLADIDGDGDLDILVGGTGFYGVAMFENTGTAQAPAFGLPVYSPFGLTDYTYGARIAIVDLDDDGDLDLLVGGYYGDLRYYENTGSSSNPSFGAGQTNPFGLQPAYDWSFITGDDVDRDGDYDLMVGEYYGDMLYYENTGTKSNPQFAAPVANVSSIMNAGYLQFPVLADMDGDTDPDLLVSVYDTSTRFTFYQNLVTAIGHLRARYRSH